MLCLLSNHFFIEGAMSRRAAVACFETSPALTKHEQVDINIYNISA
jgi:hypothetical protein